MHVMLMLGALKCKGVNKGIYGKYTAFIDKKSNLLSAYNNVLKAHFLRVNGIADGPKSYEDFNTKLGNSHSGGVQTRSYCEITDTLLSLATDASDQELAQLALQFSESRMGAEDICDASVAVMADAAEPMTALATAKVDEPAAASAKVEKTPAQASPPSAAAALEAAAAALQSAAASLKAQPTAPAITDATEKAAADSTPTAKPALLQPAADMAPVS